MEKRTNLDQVMIGRDTAAATLTFRNLRYSVKAKKGKEKVIIDNVSGCVWACGNIVDHVCCAGVK